MAAAAPLALLSTGLSVAGSVFGGMSQAQGDEYQAQQEVNAAEIGRTQAAQTSSNMTQDLTHQIQSIQAIRASANVEDNSPTGEAIVNSVRARGQQQIGIKVGNILDQANMDQNAAAFYTSSAGDALIGGFLGGFGKLASGLGGAYSSAGSPSFSNLFGLPSSGLFPGGI